MTDPLRIAVTLEQCWHDVPGGVATSALSSVDALRAHTDLELVGVSARHRHPAPAAFRPSIPVRSLPLPRPLLYESWHRLRRPAVQRATGPVDVIHVTGMAMPPPSAPLVVTVHDLAFVDHPEHFTPRGVRFFHRAIELAERDASVVVCPSHATLEDCRAHGFAPERLRVVPWGIEVRPVDPATVDAVLTRLGVTRPYVLSNGTIEPRKNLRALLDAFARLDDDRAQLVVAGPEGWNDELATLQARLGPRVTRVGFLAPDDLRALHAGAEVFCYPSLREGFGLPVLEAMAQGTPVVTSIDSAMAEIVGTDDGPAGPAAVLVDPRDPAALADALDALLADPSRRARMGAAALGRAATFSWARTASGLEQAYRDATAGASPAEAGR